MRRTIQSRRPTRRGQTAMEYIVTYGWAFLVILVVMGAMSYFGFISPSRWVPEKCDFGTQLVCQDYQAKGDNLNLYLANNYGKDIIISKVEQLVDGNWKVVNCSVCVNGTVFVAGGTIDLLVESEHLIPGAKQQIPLRMTFTRVGGATSHFVTGFLYLNVREET